MPPFHVGIDFGTAQTKICLKNLLTGNYTFHKFFSNGEYFLPSTIKINVNGRIDVGETKSPQLRFFKMLALHDKEFEKDLEYAGVDKTIDYTVPENSDTQYESADIVKYLQGHPEICTVIYLAYCINDVAESIQDILSVNSTITKATKSKKGNKYFDKVLSIFQRKTTVKAEKEELNLLITVGIPTEYDSQANRKRRRKMYEMLWLAKSLSKHISANANLVKTKLWELSEIVKNDFRALKSIESDKELVEKFNEAGLFVIAETTAGIEPIRSDRKRVLFEILNSRDHEKQYADFRRNYAGNYMTMDIGAGTTDISFFKLKVFENGEIKMDYYASQSIQFACNQLVGRYIGTIDLDEINKFDFNKVDVATWNKAQIGIRNELYKIVSGIGTQKPEISPFGRVAYMLRKTKQSIRENWNYEEPPPYVTAKGCYVYGGGSRYNEFGKGQLLLYSGGAKNAYVPQAETTTEIIKLIRGNEIISNLSLTDITGRALDKKEIAALSKNLDLLNVSLGLAMLTPGNRGDNWLDLGDYVSTKVDIKKSSDISAHPFNEDCFIYDVFLRRWS
jgi:hypothetical protein